METLSPPAARRWVYCAGCGRTDDGAPADPGRLVLSGWPRCCGAAMLLVDAPGGGEAGPTDRAGPADQRRGARRLPESLAIALRAGRVGRELPGLVVDLSAGGLGVRLGDDLAPGQQVQVDLAPAAGGRVRRPAEVRWCLAVGDGTFQAGLQFARPLTFQELAALAP